MLTMEWIFSGIGTAAITLLIQAAIACFCYKLYKNNTVKQTQIAGKNSQQSQNLKMNIDSADRSSVKGKVVNSYNQYQKAGDGSSQEQAGDVNNGN